MLGDAPRTGAYRDALERNPALLAGARVLDVGCGTGILSLFAARGGAAVVGGVDGSARMAATAAALAADNGMGPPPGAAAGAPGRVTTVAGKLEELKELPAGCPQQFDVLVSEWMGYCLLFESMLDTVLCARDRFLKPGGAVLPDIATMHLAGFSRVRPRARRRRLRRARLRIAALRADAPPRCARPQAAEGAPFWDDVYGFNFSRVAREVRAETLAGRAARVCPVAASAVITAAAEFKRFDLTTMAPSDVEFHADFALPVLDEGARARARVRQLRRGCHHGWHAPPRASTARSRLRAGSSWCAELLRLCACAQRARWSATAWWCGSTRSSARVSARRSPWCCPRRRTRPPRTGRRRSSTSRRAVCALRPPAHRRELCFYARRNPSRWQASPRRRMLLRGARPRACICCLCSARHVRLTRGAC
jgi:protein arginine N-methyltransferase 3